jgi:hypothetical protein
MLVFLVQGHYKPIYHDSGGPSLSTLGLLVAGACVGMVAFYLFIVGVPRARRAIRAMVAERRRTREAASAEERARAMMSELCPHGWQAQITMFASPGDAPHERRNSERTVIALDWTAFDHERQSEPVIRRVWAESIVAALEAMVADRRTDDTLEQIEQAAAAEGTLWSDP